MTVISWDHVPVFYADWTQWRSEMSAQRDRPLVEAGSCFCVTCSGNGHIYEPARNGEGLIPTPCVSCFGRGTV